MLFPAKSTLAASVAAALAVTIGGCATTRPIVPTVAPDVDFSHAQAYEVRLSSYDYAPEEIRLQAGTPYALTLTNVAGTGHTFTAPEFFAAARIQAADASKVADGEIELGPGESAVVHLVPTAGTYELVCTETGHKLLGMTGRIVVG